jgi:hypothetical protein
VGFMVDKVALGQGFAEYFDFSCQFEFHRLLQNLHHLSSGAGTIGQTVAAVPSGLSLTPWEKQLGNGVLYAVRAIANLCNNRTVGRGVFMRSMPRLRKESIVRCELVVGESPAGKNVSTEAEDIVGIRHQAMAGEDTADLEDLLHAVVNCRVFELAIEL